MSAVPDVERSPMLSLLVSVEDYTRLEGEQDRDGIADFIYTRFGERYLWPVQKESSVRSGFAMIAIACLMIEALESFRLGLENTKNAGENTFKSFFANWPEFEEFNPVSQEFYRNIRCGLLHQAEVTAGWRIRRKGPLLDTDSRVINAKKFLDQLELALSSYCTQLRTSEWEAEIWANFRTKMGFVCENCRRPRDAGEEH